MLVSRYGAKSIFETAQRTNPGTFSLEDVFFTGVLREKAHLPGPYATEPAGFFGLWGRQGHISVWVEASFGHTQETKMEKMIQKWEN